MLFDKQEVGIIKTAALCPFCSGSKVVKTGIRSKKHEEVQVYFCKLCQKKFTPGVTKHKTFPLRVILDCITLYNRLNSLDESAQKVSQHYGVTVSPQNITNWLKSYAGFIPFTRMRDFVKLNYKPKEIIAEARLHHEQVYNFKYHRAKLRCQLEQNFSHYTLRPIREFLELVFDECPHQKFRTAQKRASYYKNTFNLDQVRIKPTKNAACHMANFVLQAVGNNKLRHEILQEYMLVNDSVTIATELPVLLTKEDILHYQNELGFEIPLSLEDEEALTGHIDILQMRNGCLHILDYKPSARKQKPIDQLTLYALALSRLTTIRLYNIKCGWFDENDYFEFFPLHVVLKKKKKGGRKKG
ncbi:MAG: PD-(D/E)XK nuclease family protein [bacterium]